MNAMRRRAMSFLYVAAVLAGCDAGVEPSVIVRDSAGVRITTSTVDDRTFATVDSAPSLTLGGADVAGPTQFSNIRGIHVDPSGNVWVADGASAEVRVFAPDGSHVRTVGGQGEGPGEFRRIRLLGAFDDGTIALWDDATSRLTQFDPAGDLLGTVQVPSGEAIGPQPLATFGDGTLLALERRTYQAPIEAGVIIDDTARLFQLDPRDASQTPITNVPGPLWLWTGRSQVPLPFTINPGRAVHEDAVYVVQGPDFRVRVFRDGRLAESFGVERDARPVTGEALDEYVAFFEDAMPDSSRRAEYLSAIDHPARPEYMPAYDAVVVADDGVTWARIHAPDLLAPATWDVYDPDRAWLGRVETPADFWVHAVAHGRLYGVWRDDFAVEHIWVYGFEPVTARGAG